MYRAPRHDSAPIYDTRTPWGGMVFVRVRPPMMKMKMGGTQHAGMQHGRSM